MPVCFGEGTEREIRIFKNTNVGSKFLKHSNSIVKISNYDFFIVYSRQDSSEIATKINHTLKKIGINSFCDLHDDPELKLQEEIYERLKSSENILLILSIKSHFDIKNKNSWIYKELQLANNLKKPIFVVDCTKQINFKNLKEELTYIRPFGIIYSNLSVEDYYSFLNPLKRQMSSNFQETDLLWGKSVEMEEIISSTLQVTHSISYYKNFDFDNFVVFLNRSLFIRNNKIRLRDIYKLIYQNTDDVLPLINTLISILVLNDIRNNIPMAKTKELLNLVKLLVDRIPTPNLFFSKSSQGFIFLPIYSRIIDGQIKELIRFHLWNYEGESNFSTHDFAIHSHQSYAKSWVLGGNLVNNVYEIGLEEKETNLSKFEPFWDSSKDYKLNHSKSTIKNTNQSVSANKKYSLLLTEDDCYEVLNGQYHTSEVVKSIDFINYTGTLFCFDSSKGWLKEAGVIGPTIVDESTFNKNELNINAKSLFTAIDNLTKNICQ